MCMPNIFTLKMLTPKLKEQKKGMKKLRKTSLEFFFNSYSNYSTSKSIYYSSLKLKMSCNTNLAFE